MQHLELMKYKDLPKLTGTRKQIKWAKQLRRQFFEQHGKDNSSWVLHTLAQTSAAWWIASR